jgi:SAM-dependent methyltransferase
MPAAVTDSTLAVSPADRLRCAWRRHLDSAVDAAARRYPECEWIVANADRFVPYSDSSFSIVLSITARMNSSEFRRVLRPGGRLVVGLPAPDDLVELRGAGRDRVPAPSRHSRRTSRSLIGAASPPWQTSTPPPFTMFLLSIYRPMRTRPPEAMRVTFSLDLLLFRPA